MKYSDYIVTVTPKIPTWNNTEYTVKVYAKDRASAIKEAREQYNENFQDHGHGAATYSAKKVSSDN